MSSTDEPSAEALSLFRQELVKGGLEEMSLRGKFPLKLKDMWEQHRRTLPDGLAPNLLSPVFMATSTPVVSSGFEIDSQSARNRLNWQLGP